MEVKKDRKGSFLPRTQSYTAEDPDGYDYTVVVLDGGFMCMVHGKACAHVDAVKAFAEKKARK